MHWLNLFAKFSVTERTAGVALAMRHSDRPITTYGAPRLHSSRSMALFTFTFFTAVGEPSEKERRPFPFRSCVFLLVGEEKLNPAGKTSCQTPLIN